jgi:chromosome partitioning protein
VMKLADKVLIPLQPSIFDINATHDFINQLLDHRRGPSVQLAVVGTRTREGTIATDQLRGFLESVRVPLLGFLRDTQNYVHLAAHGLTLWDVSSVRFERDREQWEPIMVWAN